MITTRRSALAGLFSLPLLSPRIEYAPEVAPADRLIDAARARIGVTTLYDPAYVQLSYPGGDISSERGVCTDVVVRAYRAAFGFDLQRAVHEDMAHAFEAYPAIWGLTRPDRNIDHRRVPNLETFLRRQGAERERGDFAPGDLITCRLPRNLPHIGIVSDRRTDDGTPMVIHNIGRGTEETPLIGRFERERRFRFFPA